MGRVVERNVYKVGRDLQRRVVVMANGGLRHQNSRTRLLLNSNILYTPDRNKNMMILDIIQAAFSVNSASKPFFPLFFFFFFLSSPFPPHPA